MIFNFDYSSKELIDWYNKNIFHLPLFKGGNSLPDNVKIFNERFIDLSVSEIANLYNLLPENVQEFSVLEKIVGQSSMWYHRDSSKGDIKTTHKRSEAVSDYALFLSYADYSSWKKDKPAMDIFLYQMPDDLVDERTKKVVMYQKFLHELGHSVFQPLLYSDLNTILKFRNKSVSGTSVVKLFYYLVKDIPPISKYSSTFRRRDGKFILNRDGIVNKVSLGEEFAETFSAYFLNFSYIEKDDFKNKHPFFDRPNVKKFIDSFLEMDLLMSYDA